MARLVLGATFISACMSDRTNSLEILPWDDPVHAEIPKLRDADLGAVYYGQRKSGDFFDFVSCSGGRVLFGLFDVAGNLEKARPVIVAMQKELRNLAIELFDDHSANEMDGIAELWIRLNREVIRAAQGVHQCAAFIACYNEQMRTISYVNAGHTPGLVSDRAEISELRATALPLGLFSHAVPEPGMVALRAGHSLLLLSKGVVEARRRNDEFGLESAKAYLQEVGPRSAHETCIGLLSRVQQFMGTAPTHNDVTALSLVCS